MRSGRRYNGESSMSSNIQTYLDLVPSQHSNKPNFISVLNTIIQPLVDIQNLMQQMPEYFDLNLAVGVQLDAVGEWVGITRYLPQEITGVYFAFNEDGVGFNLGVWKGPFDPDSGLIAMPDSIYRIMIQFKILSNKWDGTIPTAYADFATVFPPGQYVFIIDNQDMSMSVGLVGIDLGPIGIGILEQGYFPFKPEGVRIKEYIVDPLGRKIFGFNLNNDVFGGFNVGYFATTIVPL